MIKFKMIKVVDGLQMLKIEKELKHFVEWSITALFWAIRQLVVVIRYKELPLHAA
jgi:hypothetical protein